MGKNQVTLTFAADSSGLEASFRRVKGESESTATSFQKFSRVARAGAIATLGLLAYAAKGAFQGIASGEKVSAQTAAALKSTGNAANTSQTQIENLALALSKKSGVDDELIQKSQNLLLTFTKVRNEAGKGNAIFDRATASALDMSVALGTDLQGSTNMLAKALQDPVKGITAMQKAGVSFTTSQKDQIKALVESGQTLKAQKLILKELEVQYGGSAKAAGDTMSGKLERTRLALERTSESILTTVLPALESFASGAAKVGEWMEKNKTTARVLTGVVLALSIGVLAVSAATKVWTAATTVATVANRILNAVLKANPFIRIATLVLALGAALVIAYKRSETFRNVVQTAMRLASTAFEKLQTAVSTALNFVKRNWPIIATVISGPFAPLVALATNAFGIRSALTGAISKTVSAVKATWSKITGVISGVASAVYNSAVSVGKRIVSGAIDGLAGLGSMIKQKAEQYIRSGLSNLNPFSPVEHGGQIYIGEPIVTGAVKGLKPLEGKLKGELTEALRGAISAAKDYATSNASTLSGIVGNALDARAAKGVANLGNTPEAKRIQEITAAQEAATKLREKTALEEALAKAKTEKDKAAATLAINDWLLEQEKRELETAIAGRAEAIQKEHDDRKDIYERSLTDLTDRLNRGLISQEQYNQGIVDALHATGVDYADVGTYLGSSFANAFRDAIDALQYEAGRIPELLKQEKGLALVPVKKAAPKAKKKPVKKRANGGLISGPELALIGEAGPELILPLGRPERSRNLARAHGVGGATVIVQSMVVRDDTDVDRVAVGLSRRLSFAGGLA